MNCRRPCHYRKRLRAYKKSFGTKVCLHPDAPDACQGSVIRAHSVSRAKDLTAVARNGQVYYFHPNPMAPADGPVLRGASQVSTFSGFCALHDKNTFAPIDDPDFTVNAESAFLLAYRALCRELYGKHSALLVVPTLREADRGRSAREQLGIQRFADDYEAGTQRGLQDLEKQKSRFDDALSSGRMPT